MRINFDFYKKKSLEINQGIIGELCCWFSYSVGKSPFPFVGRLVEPIKNKSTSLAASRPSEIAQTINDCPLLISPAVKI